MSLEGRRVLERYVVEALLGKGGMGAVYRGRHEALGFPVALKVILVADDSELISRFLVEAHAMARVRHPNVVSILDYGVIDGQLPCIAMEFVRGETLEARITRKGPMTWSELGPLVMGALVGLHVIHEAGIVHRDLKPANLLVADGVPDLLKIADFGIARISTADGRLTRAGTTLGTPAYMALEHAMCAEVDRRADLYSFALVLYEALTGILPHATAGMLAPLMRSSHGIERPLAPAHAPPIPEHVVDAIMHTLAERPDDRPASAWQLAALLDASISVRSTPVPAPRVPAAPAQTTLDPGARGPMYDSTTRASPPGLTAPAQPPQMLVEVNAPGTLLFVARLPLARIQLRDERAWLARQAASARTFTIGNRIWVVIAPATVRADAAAHAARIAEALTNRYSDASPAPRFAWCVAAPNFAVSVAALSGAAPLPDELARLVNEAESDAPARSRPDPLKPST